MTKRAATSAINLKADRVDTEGAKAFHEMQVNIDQAGRDDAVFDIDDRRAVGAEIDANGRDLAVAHADIELAVCAAGRIDQAAALEHAV